MKWAIKLVSLSIALLCWGAASAAETKLKFFERENASAALLVNGERMTLLLAGGAQPRGAATSADCFVKADVLKKNGSDYYEGNLSAVHNSIAALSASDVSRKKAGVYVFKDSIRVGGVQTVGLCADDIEFSGSYSMLGKGDTTYKDKFFYYASLMHEDAIHLIGAGDAKSAIEDLAPFAENYSARWLDSKNGHDVLIPLIGDYGFAIQGSGDDKGAISVFKSVIKIDPARAATWLNLADSYWNLQMRDKAKYSYEKYISVMSARGLMSRIPDRVFARTAGN